MFCSHIRQTTVAQSSCTYFEFGMQVVPHPVVTSAESEDYLLTYRQLKISIFGIKFWMESFPLFKVVAFGYHFCIFIADLLICLWQSHSVLCQPISFFVTRMLQ
jgi:hypothetical protein